MRTFESIDDLVALVGQTIGHSEWVSVPQSDINLFADATGDHQWIHVDPDQAANGPFKTTIAHGFLTLSLLPRMWSDMYEVKGTKLAVNYGLNKVRFLSPVAVDSRVRAESSVVAADALDGGVYQVTLSTTVEIENQTKPACVAESIVRYIT